MLTHGHGPASIAALALSPLVIFDSGATAIEKNGSELSLPLIATSPFGAFKKIFLVSFYWRSVFVFENRILKKKFLEKVVNFVRCSFKKKHVLKIIVMGQLLTWYRKGYFHSVYSYKWKIDCRNIHSVHLDLWVDCCRFINRLYLLSLRHFQSQH